MPAGGLPKGHPVFAAQGRESTGTCRGSRSPCQELGRYWSCWGLLQVCSGSPAPQRFQLVRFLTLLMPYPEPWQSLTLSFKY